MLTDVATVRRTPTISGKRKASVIDEVESPRERKRARDGNDSEPIEEDEAGKSF